MSKTKARTGDSPESLMEALQKSKAEKTAMLRRFGFVPLSVLKISRAKLSKQMHIFQHEHIERGFVRESADHVDSARAKHNQRLKAAADSLGRKVAMAPYAEEKRMTASTMAPELVDFFIKYYVQPGDVYLDPFMGQGIRLQVAYALGLHYYGYDICEEFFEYCSAIWQRIYDERSDLACAITLGDSRVPDKVPDGCGDFCFTSPPYWDLEFYGDEPEQLGTGHTYGEFLDGMRQVAVSWRPKFKDGATVVINVNDFRHDGKMIAYHADTIELFEESGYRLHDIWIIDGLVGGLPRAFGVSFNLKRIAPKVHEYGLVFIAD